MHHFKLWIFHFSFSLQLSPYFHCSFNSDFRLNFLPDPFLCSGDTGYRSNPYCSSSNILTWKTLYITSFYVCAVTSYHLAFLGFCSSVISSPSFLLSLLVLFLPLLNMINPIHLPILKIPPLSPCPSLLHNPFYVK